MRFDGIKRIVNSIKFRLLALYFTLYVVSFLAFMGISFALLYNMLNKNEDQFVINELAEIAGKHAGGSFDTLINICNDEIMENGFTSLIFRLHANGRDVLLPSAEQWKDYPLRGLNRFDTLSERIVFIDSAKGGMPLKVGTTILPGGYVLQVGYFSESLAQLKSNFMLIFGIIFLPILLVGLGGGYLMARNSLMGITRVNQTAASIYRGNLADRVERSENGDEIDQLSETFNLMLARLELLIGNMTEMVDNIAHDLRTPLTRLRGKLEIALMRQRTPAHYQEVMQGSLEDIELLVRLINTVLNIAEAEAGTILLNKTSIDMHHFLENIYEFYLPMVEASGVGLRLGEMDKTEVRADANRLWQAVSNLLDNAFKFTPPGGLIQLSVQLCGAEVAICVTDTGTGIAPSELVDIFRRFYRHGEGKDDKGYGLGLSLVKAVAEIHGGRAAVESTPNVGSRFCIILPVLPPGDIPHGPQ